MRLKTRSALKARRKAILFYGVLDSKNERSPVPMPRFLRAFSANGSFELHT